MKPYTARPYVGAPDDTTTEAWALCIVFLLAWIACGWAL